MNILIVGCGKVGYTTAQHLCDEGHNVTIIDKNPEAFENITASIDAQFLEGNGLTRQTLNEASIKTSDLVICLTDSDETNILCCVTAKQLGAKHAIARVRDPEYAEELTELKRQLGVDVTINPEQQSAFEISRLLRFPSASNIETFVGGRVEMVSFTAPENNILCGKTIQESFKKLPSSVIIAAIERGDKIIIPSGATVINPGDIVRIMGRRTHLTDFFDAVGFPVYKIKSVVIIGGGETSFYLSDFLLKNKIGVKIIEIDTDKCNKIESSLSGAIIINADGTDEDILKSEEISAADAVVCLTNLDEKNVMTGLLAKQLGVPKVIVRINHINLNIVRTLDVGSVICPKFTTAYQIIRYVRGFEDTSDGSNINTLYKISTHGKEYIEAIEFDILGDSACVGKKLRDLRIRPGFLIGCIVRSAQVTVPDGNSVILEGDTVIIISKHENITELDEILLR